MSMLRFRVYMQMSVCEVDHELNERLCFALCERIQDSLGFWIPGTGFQSLSVGFGFWIPISSRIPGSWAVFWFPQTNISRILESKFPYMYPAKQTNFVVPRIWTLNLTESRGESKNDSKGEAFMMAAAINVPRGRSFVQKKRRRICLLCSLPYIGWCVVKMKLLMVAWAKKTPI